MFALLHMFTVMHAYYCPVYCNVCCCLVSIVLVHPASPVAVCGLLARSEGAQKWPPRSSLYV